jgi:hypothetical protein
MYMVKKRQRCAGLQIVFTNSISAEIKLMRW